MILWLEAEAFSREFWLATIFAALGMISWGLSWYGERLQRKLEKLERELMAEQTKRDG